MKSVKNNPSTSTKEQNWLSLALVALLASGGICFFPMISEKLVQISSILMQSVYSSISVLG